MNSEEEAFAAIEKLHQTGTKTVVLSSSTLGSKGVLLCLASTAVSELYGGDGVAPGIQGHFLLELCQCSSGGWGGVRGMPAVTPGIQVISCLNCISVV